MTSFSQAIFKIVLILVVHAGQAAGLGVEELESAVRQGALVDDRPSRVMFSASRPLANIARRLPLCL